MPYSEFDGGSSSETVSSSCCSRKTCINILRGLLVFWLVLLTGGVLLLAFLPDTVANAIHGEPTKPTPAGITNFVGIGYNIISGNPEGGDVRLGGIDPGFMVTRPILKLTYDDGQLTSDLKYQVPDQVVFTPRSSCVKTSAQETVYGTQSYIKKISVDVKWSGTLHTPMRSVLLMYEYLVFHSFL